MYRIQAFLESYTTQMWVDPGANLSSKHSKGLVVRAADLRYGTNLGTALQLAQFGEDAASQARGLWAKWGETPPGALDGLL